jgi:hypothetical protein
MIMASFSTNNIGGLVFLQGILFGLSGSLIYLVHPSIPLLRGIEGLTFRRLTLHPVTGLRKREGFAQVSHPVEVDWEERHLLSYVLLISNLKFQILP